MNKQLEFFCNIDTYAAKTYIPRKTVYVNGQMNKKLSTPRDKKSLRKIKQKYAMEQISKWPSLRGRQT